MNSSILGLRILRFSRYLLNMHVFSDANKTLMKKRLMNLIYLEKDFQKTISWGAQNEAFDGEVGGFGGKTLKMRELEGDGKIGRKKRNVYIGLILV